MTSEGSVSSNSLRRRKKSSKVHLNIYTLSQAKGISNKLSNKFGFKKAYHTAVEVYGIEYSYDETRGIYAAKPREVKNAKLKKALYMGTANMKWPEVKNIVSELREQYDIDNYDLITRNCHHFCESLCQELVAMSIPSHLTKHRKAAQLHKPIIPRVLAQSTPPKGDNIERTLSTVNIWANSELPNEDFKDSYSESDELCYEMY
mmetsp:Transcript_8240/g.9150  ORF Transcript_8240/g.9150 Transcript_8240/m.9150 type:complete len:204 (-) Transcript_8240:420-1031(-)